MLRARRRTRSEQRVPERLKEGKVRGRMEGRKEVGESYRLEKREGENRAIGKWGKEKIKEGEGI